MTARKYADKQNQQPEKNVGTASSGLEGWKRKPKPNPKFRDTSESDSDVSPVKKTRQNLVLRIRRPHNMMSPLPQKTMKMFRKMSMIY